MKQPHQLPESDEIDLVELLQKVWQGRKIAITISVVFALLGVIFAFSSPNIYTATTTFIPKGKSNGSVGGSLSGLASLAGISLGGMSGGDSEIPPAMYPMVLNSIPFLEKTLLLEVPLNGQNIVVKEYLLTQMHFKESNSFDFLNFLKKYTIGLPALLKGKIFAKMNAPPSAAENITIKRLTYEDEQLFNYLKELVTISVDKKEGFIKLSVQDKDPQVAAIIAQNTQHLLQQEVIDFKIKNAQELLTFTETLYTEKKAAFEALQDELATFRDQHQNISSGLFENKLSRLESELAITSAVNEELAKQVEQARIQVSKDTPIFTIIDPVVIPNQRTSPKRTLIVLGFTFLGFFLGLGYALIKEPFAAIRKQILESNKSA
ncbi:Wzz/FepE/Etk N-terminal domain-containing protein [Cyclobacteriaceae bacterium]|nr:Wzz/FepE/Etk N-terminal domain-containing protein [Cyclobacteriaceae bacterium]